jgi:hypothetical protein
MLPNKLTHGEKLADLFRKYNEMVDYLHGTRLVAGNGIRINHLPAGMTIESTATATGGTPSAPAAEKGHPFDLQIINDGTEESPVWKVKVFDSLGSNNTAGIVYIGTTRLYPPAQNLSVPAGPNPSYIDLVIHYENNQYVMDFVIYTSGNNPYENNDQYCLKRIGTVSWQNNEPTAVSRIIQDIEIFGRWA